MKYRVTYSYRWSRWAVISPKGIYLRWYSTWQEAMNKVDLLIMFGSAEL